MDDDVGDLFFADHRALAGLAGFPLLFEFTLLVGHLALLVAHAGGLLEVLILDRGLFVAAHLLDLFFELAVDGRRRHRLDAHAAGGLVDQVDRLVRQEAVGDVAVGQIGCGLQRVVADRDLVVHLVAVAQALEDLNRLVD